MDFKIAVVVCVMLISLTGCFGQPKEKHVQPLPPINPITQPSGFLDEIVKLIKSRELELFPNDRERWVLNDIKATSFSISESTAKRPEEYIDVYIFKDAKAREEGLTDFKKQKDKDDMKEYLKQRFPILWQNSNVLVVYWYYFLSDEKIAFAEEELDKTLKATEWEKIKS